MTSVDVCRKNGWIVGDILLAKSGFILVITAIGRHEILAIPKNIEFRPERIYEIDDAWYKKIGTMDITADKLKWPRVE